ncbi:MAG: hypothetical protein IM504_11455 [Microcystis sp. M038S2]|jgi:hypothetical protein|uniref:hypothetical protein n=1 Tax=unclassified Microcystis TaxID=2643300 RepID=UPI00258CC3F1|nr:MULTISPECIES: hypothetical protein [unclassified Microcystis]NCR22905.1 hypothetical protein [Microcystis aeruginosa L111-01]NCS49593.1 hypothetical protein [Microcystis aeruginosa BK11-02]MCA2686670.1 hypothetical protein [Microcystis sp. M046S2]MCA2705457.1 hypothetical protein [Microcystis sp. M038S2]MCA2947997.1 hypothetical protein [Microcystis sp. M109S1]
MAIEAGASIVIVGEHPDNGKFYKIGEVRQDGWILTTDNRLFHYQFFEVCSPLEPRPRGSKIQRTRAKRSTTLSPPSSISIASNSFLGESEPPIFLGENLGQNDRISEISPKKKTVNPVTSSEIFLGENDRHQSSKLISPKKNPSGSLYAFNQEKKDKHGNVKTYPKVEGDRSMGNPDHWFWAYCWDEKVNGKWKTFKRSVPREKLSKVRIAIDANQPVSEILKIIG